MSGGRDEYEGRRGGGHRHQGGRGGGGAKYTPPNPREKEDIERAIQASLSTMKEEDMKKEKPKEPVVKSVERGISQSEENFPVLGAAKTSSVPVTTQENIGYKTSLANVCALGDNKSVQHGSLNDFPSLGTSSANSVAHVTVSNAKTKDSAKPVFVTAVKPVKREEDFPELPSTNKPSAPVSGSWIKPSKPTKQSDNINKKETYNKHQNKHSNSIHKLTYTDKDFPSLGTPSSSSASGMWLKPKNANNNKLSNKSSASENTEPFVGDIRDRFSPVNVPDLDKQEKTKNKKKKKKDKVTEIKEEKSASLKGNSSLDDIASLLMGTPQEAKKEQENTEKHKTVDKQEPVEKIPAKKKEDKVEKLLESSKLDQVAAPVRSEPPVVDDYPLNPKVTFSVEENEFPALPKGPAKKPPPGFREDAVSAKAPPGLSKPPNKPPPGFMSQSIGMSAVDVAMEADSLPMSSDLTNFQYTQPDDFQNRNQMLIASIQSMCVDDSSKFTDFKTISGEFRRSEIDASSYYRKCEETLGKKNFHQIFPELMALLPDIDKQQELLSVYTASLKLHESQKPSGKFKNSKGAWTPSASGFLACQRCRQVLVRKDYNSHMSSHSLASDFPALLSDTNTPVANLPSGAWIKAK